MLTTRAIPPRRNDAVRPVCAPVGPVLVGSSVFLTSKCNNFLISFLLFEIFWKFFKKNENKNSKKYNLKIRRFTGTLFWGFWGPKKLYIWRTPNKKHCAWGIELASAGWGDGACTAPVTICHRGRPEVTLWTAHALRTSWRDLGSRRHASPGLC